MRTIPESFVVNVDITRIDQPVGSESFGIVNFAGISTVIGQTERIRSYESSEDVLADFGSTAEEFKAAEAFFAQNPRPEFMKISRLLTGDVPGFMEGLAVVASLAAFQALSDGEFRIGIDGVVEDITALDFSSDLSFDDVAATIQAAVQAVAAGGYTAATVEFNATTNKFKITSGTTGDLSSVSFLEPVPAGIGTDISGASFMNALTGETIPGVTAGATIVDEIGKIQAVDDNWYWLTIHKGVRDDADVLSVAAYVAGLKKIYVTNSNDQTAPDGQISSDIGSQLKATNNFRVSPGLQLANVDQYLDVAIASTAASVDFDAADSTITLAYKDMSGITVDSFNGSEASILAGSATNTDDKHYNINVNIGNRPVLFQGKVSNGEFIDIIHGTDWLEARIRNLVFELIIDSPKLPYTDDGIVKIENRIGQALKEGINNGLLSGSATNFPNGQPYEINVPRVIDIAEPDRAARRLNGITFKAKYAGAIHFVTINGTITV